MNTRTRNLAALTAALSLLTALTGCARSGASPTSPADVQPGPSSSQQLDPGATDTAPRSSHRAPASPRPHRHPSPEPAVTTEPTGERAQLQQLFRADQPVGTGPEIALRFLQALQDGQDLAAAHELYVFGRRLLAQQDMSLLHQVMRDVAGNAGLDGAGPCTSARPVSAQAAVVTCGDLNVVVHVLAAEYGSGVLISDLHPRWDTYAGPHTHAFTTVDL